MKVAFIGFGELGQQLYNFVCAQYEIDTPILFDDNYEGSIGEVFPFKDFSDDKFADYSFFIGLGYKHLGTKLEILKTLSDLKRNLPNFIHPTSYVSSLATLGQGIYIYPMCNIDKEVIIRSGCLINNSVTISHNASIYDCTYISPGVVLSGNVQIGKRVFVGTGSMFSNNVTIGDDVTIGIGTIVTKDVPNQVTVIGNPMQILNKKLNLL